MRSNGMVSGHNLSGAIRESALKTWTSLTPGLPRFQLFLLWLSIFLVMFMSTLHTASAQSTAWTSSVTLPDAPQPQTPASSDYPKPQPCVPINTSKTSSVATTPSHSGDTVGAGATPRSSASTSLRPCPAPHKNWYQRFADGPHDKPLTPADKGWLAARNVVDPFNIITILGEAGISVASNPNSAYGPGMAGYGRYVGVSFTQDMTGEFFNTFLIPSIAHQDPHYHRMEHASVSRRVMHTFLQVVWTQGDNGKGMPNYANIFGFAIDDEISNLYVPGRVTNAPATAERYGTAFATAPIGNLVSEFLPDVADHIHVQVVIIQRIINQVAKTNSGSP